MIKFYSMILIFVFCTIHSFAQDQIENGDFENWSSEVLFERPDDWVIGIDPIFTGLVTRSNDASDQNFSARIATEERDGEVIPGALILGVFDFGTEEFESIPYDASVDSFIVHLKYDIQPGDTGIILISQKVAGFDIFSFQQLTGTVDDWTRLAIPMTSTTQDSILIVISPSDIIAEEGVEGSVVLIDDLSFVDANSTPPPLPNGSFENWTEVSNSNPDNWDSFNRLLALAGLPPNTTRSDDAVSGNSSVRMEVVEYFGDTIPSWLIYGTINDEFTFTNTPFNGTPTRLTGSYKYQPAGSDRAGIIVSLLSGGALAGGDVMLLSPSDEFVDFEIPISLLLFPDTLSLAINAGNNPGSVLWLDNLAFDNMVSTEEAELLDGLSLSPNPAREWLNVGYAGSTEEMRLRLMDIQGRMLQEHQLPASQNGGQLELDVTKYNPGIYIVEISQGKLRVSRKVTLQ